MWSLEGLGPGRTSTPASAGRKAEKKQDSRWPMRGRASSLEYLSAGDERGMGETAGRWASIEGAWETCTARAPTIRCHIPI